MNTFIKLFHYSATANIKEIDPAYFGTGVAARSECKYGKTGLNKSYFYMIDQPETCVVSKHRYEVYLPANWQALIYDLSLDKENFYDLIKAQTLSAYNRMPYNYEYKEIMEKLLVEAGYKGYYASKFQQLPHAMVLFEKISTAKPTGSYKAFSWNKELLEEKKPKLATNCRLFDKPNLQGSNEEQPQSLMVKTR